MKEIITSWDDGCLYDVKLAKLLKKYNVKGIFYIPSCCELSEQQILEIEKMGHEIGGHTFSHPEDMKKLKNKEAKFEIGENKKWLEKILKHKITSFCYPKGRFNEDTIRIVKECGYSEARTVAWGNNRKFINRYRQKPSAFAHPDKTKFNGLSWDFFAKKQLDSPTGDYFHLWGHSKDLEKYDMWFKLEELLKHINLYESINH